MKRNFTSTMRDILDALLCVHLITSPFKGSGTRAATGLRGKTAGNITMTTSKMTIIYGTINEGSALSRQGRKNPATRAVNYSESRNDQSEVNAEDRLPPHNPSDYRLKMSDGPPGPIKQNKQKEKEDKETAAQNKLQEERDAK